MNVVTLCGIAFLCYGATQLVGRDRKEMAAMFSFCGTILIFTPAILSLAGLWEDFSLLLENYTFKGSENLIKAFAIGMCGEVTNEVLRKEGESALASALDFSVKVAILLLSVPLWKEMFSLFEDLL